MSIPDEYISFHSGFSIPNSFNLQELLNLLIQFGFGVSEQCGRWCRVVCAWEDLKSHVCFGWLLFDFCRPTVSETIMNMLIFFFFEKYLGKSFNLVFHICAHSKHSLFNTSTIVPSVAQQSNSKLLFRLWS